MDAAAINCLTNILQGCPAEGCQTNPLFAVATKSDCSCICAQLPWVLLPDLPQREAAWAKHSKALLGGKTTLHLTGGAEVTLTHRPLALEARVGGRPAIKFNAEACSTTSTAGLLR